MQVTPVNKVYLYVLAAFIAVCTPQRLHALRGICITPAYGGFSTHDCYCNCYRYKRDCKNRCVRCRHYARPEDQYFIPWFGIYYKTKPMQVIVMTDKFEKKLFS